jgi:hypothetical protein
MIIGVEVMVLGNADEDGVTRGTDGLQGTFKACPLRPIASTGLGSSSRRQLTSPKIMSCALSKLSMVATLIA